MKITLIYPSVGNRKSKKYIRSWQMEPLAIAVLAGLTPADIEVEFFDDRFGEINFDIKTDLVAITVEAYTAKRAYMISNEYKKRNIPVVMGGYHPTLVPQEASQYCDSIVVGDAEGIWSQLIEDAKNKSLKKVYQSEKKGAEFGFPKREIFSGRNYLGISLVETARGCKFSCEFCSIASFYGCRFYRKSIEDLISEIRPLKSKTIFFVDDNIIGDISTAKKLFRALAAEKIKWVSQCSINVSWDDELIDLMVESGCVGILIGFESIDQENLFKMSKGHNFSRANYHEAIKKLRKRGIIIYGTFMFGYDNDNQLMIDKTIEFATREKLFIAAFNHLMPFPGTTLYRRLVDESRMTKKEWWLDGNYRFGDVCFEPKKIKAGELADACVVARKCFYKNASILRRAFDLKANCRNVKMFFYYLFANLLLKREVNQRRNIYMGNW